MVNERGALAWQIQDPRAVPLRSTTSSEGAKATGRLFLLSKDQSLAEYLILSPCHRIPFIRTLNAHRTKGVLWFFLSPPGQKEHSNLPKCKNLSPPRERSRTREYRLSAGEHTHRLDEPALHSQQKSLKIAVPHPPVVF